MHLQRERKRWQLAATRQDYGEICTAFEALTEGLRLARIDCETGRLAANDIRTAPERLVENVKSRLRRGVSLLPRAQTTAATASSQSKAGS